MKAYRFRNVAALALASLALVACNRPDTEATIDSMATAAPPPPATPTVTVIETGKSIGDNMRVVENLTTFATNDTIYLSVVTDNAPATSTLSAKWTFQDGQTVDSTSQAVAPASAGGTTSVTQFHITKPSGWPVGTYTDDVLLDGRSVGTRTIEVR